MGAAWNEALRDVAAFSALGSAVAWLALGWACGNQIGNGTIAAAALTRLLPRAHSVALAAAGWFWLAESLESAHADAPIVLVAVTIAVAAFAITAVALSALRVVAKIAFRVRTKPFVRPAPSWVAALDPLFLEPIAHVRRRFARPPPVEVRA